MRAQSNAAASRVCVCEAGRRVQLQGGARG